MEELLEIVEKGNRLKMEELVEIVKEGTHGMVTWRETSWGVDLDEAHATEVW